MILPKKKLGFGTMRLPLLDANDGGSIDMERTKEMVDAFLEKGFTYFDTAWMYCGEKSECAVKEALVERHPRESFTLATKLPAYMLKKEEDRDWLFNQQLEKTGAGFFDYYLIHDVNSHSIQTFEGLKCFDWLVEKKQQGLVKNIGFSFHDGPELLEKVLTDHPEMEFVQLQINYLDWDSLGVQSRACYEVAVKHGKQIMVMEPVKGGALANVPQEVEQMFKTYDSRMSTASWAIRFAAGLENVCMVLSGMSDMQQMQDNMSYMADFIPLTGEEVDMVHRAADIINETIAIPCTGCAYCIVDCPKNIAIPKYFSLYNADIQEGKTGGWTSQQGYYGSLNAVFGKASDCIKCGKCEKMCPQHLPIRKYLEDVAERFE
ncbi:MAG: aldo/keto reductase [Lachnospiraceae bacterium]|nr:aldo/keto reductase [Lachnospiraceae bacterium]